MSLSWCFSFCLIAHLILLYQDNEAAKLPKYKIFTLLLAFLHKSQWQVWGCSLLLLRLIHTHILLHLLHAARGCGDGLESVPAVTGQEAGHTFGSTPVHHRADHKQ